MMKEAFLNIRKNPSKRIPSSPKRKLKSSKMSIISKILPITQESPQLKESKISENKLIDLSINQDKVSLMMQKQDSLLMTEKKETIQITIYQQKNKLIQATSPKKIFRNQ